LIVSELERYEKFTRAFAPIRKRPPLLPLLVVIDSPPTPEIAIGLLTTTDSYASSDNVLALDQVSAVSILISVASTPPPVVVIVRFPDASELSTSPIFSTALFALGVQMPAEQLMFRVVPDEMTTSALAEVKGVSVVSTRQPCKPDVRSRSKGGGVLGWG
jgi:hypothetical protein